MDYVLLTIGANKQRNHLYKAHEISKYYTADDEDVLISVFYYGDEAKQYFQEHCSLAGFRGEMTAPYLLFDIDADNLPEACRETQRLIGDLEKKGINNYKISFSGRRGFHVVIDSSYFGGFESSSVLPQKFLALSMRLTTAQIDKAIYKHLGMVRVGNTKHPKSGLYKIQIKPHDLLSPDTILDKAKTPQPLFKVAEGRPLENLIELKNQAFELIPETPFIPLQPKSKLCILSLMKKVIYGERNEATCRLASHFREQGLTYELALASLREWAKRQGFEDLNKMEKTAESVWNGGYKYGCYDWMLDERCEPECYLFRKKSTKEQADTEIQFRTLRDAHQAYIRQVEDRTGIKLGFSSRLDELIDGHFRSQLGFIVGRPRTFKSTLAQQIGDYYVRHYAGYFLYISIEMSLSMFYERQAQVSTGKSKTEIKQNHRINSLKNYERYLVTDKSAIYPLQLKEAIEEWQDKTENKIEFVIIDYLHALKTTGDSMRERTEKSVRLLDQINRELDTRMLICTHTSRAGGGDCYKPLDLDSARETAAIEDVAYFFYGLHLIRDDPTALCVQLLKNKNGEFLEGGVILDREPGTIRLKERGTSDFLNE